MAFQSSIRPLRDLGQFSACWLIMKSPGLLFFAADVASKTNWTKDRVTPGCLRNGVFLPATSREKINPWRAKQELSHSFCPPAPIAYVLAVLQENPPVSRILSHQHREINWTKLDWSEVWHTQLREGLVGDVNGLDHELCFVNVLKHTYTYIHTHTHKSFLAHLINE